MEVRTVLLSWKSLQFAYKNWIRNELKKAINDDEKVWDDYLMNFVDSLLDYKE